MRKKKTQRSNATQHKLTEKDGEEETVMEKLGAAMTDLWYRNWKRGR